MYVPLKFVKVFFFLNVKLPLYTEVKATMPEMVSVTKDSVCCASHYCTTSTKICE